MGAASELWGSAGSELKSAASPLNDLEQVPLFSGCTFPPLSHGDYRVYFTGLLEGSNGIM